MIRQDEFTKLFVKKGQKKASDAVTPEADRAINSARKHRGSSQLFGMRPFPTLHAIFFQDGKEYGFCK